jgi:hypothetical protein
MAFGWKRWLWDGADGIRMEVMDPDGVGSSGQGA